MSFPAHTIHLLCLCTSLACMALLYRGYRRFRTGLLFWSTLCFIFLSLNNLLLYANVAFVPNLDLRLYRIITNLAAVLLLLCGFIWQFA